jgi:cytochrome c-type biogenesis protein CcmH
MTPLFLLLALICLTALSFLLAPVMQPPALSLAQRRYTILVVGLCYVTVCFGLYSWIGAPRVVPLLAEREQRLDTLRREITENIEAVKTNPDHLQAWVVLGTNFLETGQIDSAVEAFRQAVVLSGGDPQLILAYVKAQVMQADGKVTDDAVKGLEMVQMMEPQNPDARYFMALRQLQDGDMQSAMSEMKALYQSLPEDSDLKAMIDQQIGRH